MTTARRDSWLACQHRKRALHKCIGCPGQTDGETWYCRECRIRRTEMDRRYRQRVKARAA